MIYFWNKPFLPSTFVFRVWIRRLKSAQTKTSVFVVGICNPAAEGRIWVQRPLRVPGADNQQKPERRVNGNNSTVVWHWRWTFDEFSIPALTVSSAVHPTNAFSSQRWHQLTKETADFPTVFDSPQRSIVTTKINLPNMNFCIIKLAVHGGRTESFHLA